MGVLGRSATGRNVTGVRRLVRQRLWLLGGLPLAI